MVSARELQAATGAAGGPIYLALLGQVFDVSRGKKHYGVHLLWTSSCAECKLFAVWLNSPNPEPWRCLVAGAANTQGVRRHPGRSWNAEGNLSYIFALWCMKVAGNHLTREMGHGRAGRRLCRICRAGRDAGVCERPVRGRGPH